VLQGLLNVINALVGVD